MAAIESKEKLTTYLCVGLRNFMVSHVAVARLRKSADLPKDVIFGTTDEEVSISLLSLCSEAGTGRLAPTDEVFDNCKWSLARALLAESFELMKEYCIQTDQMKKLKAWPHYDFARVVRNCTSHGTGGKLNRWPGDLKKRGITTVEWGNIRISESMLGQLIGVPDPAVVKLVVEELEFVKSELV